MSRFAHPQIPWHKEISILHGGQKAWCAQGYPITDVTTPHQPTNYAVKIDPSLMLTTEDIFSVLVDESITILDSATRQNGLLPRHPFTESIFSPAKEEFQGQFGWNGTKFWDVKM